MAPIKIVLFCINKVVNGCQESTDQILNTTYCERENVIMKHHSLEDKFPRQIT